MPFNTRLLSRESPRRTEKTEHYWQRKRTQRFTSSEKKVVAVFVRRRKWLRFCCEWIIWWARPSQNESLYRRVPVIMNLFTERDPGFTSCEKKVVAVLLGGGMNHLAGSSKSEWNLFTKSAKSLYLHGFDAKGRMNMKMVNKNHILLSPQQARIVHSIVHSVTAVVFV